MQWCRLTLQVRQLKQDHMYDLSYIKYPEQANLYRKASGH